MTIKRNRDKVILKDGKVSCSCCAQSECCMYSAQSVLDGILSSNDLPDQIVFKWGEPGGPIIGTVINRSESRYETNVGTTNLFVEIRVNASLVFWYRQISGPLFPSAPSVSNPCLIQGDGGLIPLNDFIEDQFANTYTIQYTLSETQFTRTLTRRSLCCWKSSDGPDQVSLYYKDGNFANDPSPQNYGWFWSFGNCGPGGSISSSSGRKTSPQNSPVGSYINTSGQITATVS